MDEIKTSFETTPATHGIEYETDPVATKLIGALANLRTTNKTAIVAAINEIYVTMLRLVESLATTKGMVGTLETLKTTAKSDAVAAINEVYDKTATNKSAIGSRPLLHTKATNDLVSAINETFDKLTGVIGGATAAGSVKVQALTLSSGSYTLPATKYQGLYLGMVVASGMSTPVHVPMLIVDDTIATNAYAEFISGNGYGMKYVHDADGTTIRKILPLGSATISKLYKIGVVAS